MLKGINDIQIGMRLELIVYNEKDEKTEASFICSIEDIVDNNKIVITAPIYEHNVFPVRVDSFVEGYVIKDNYIFKIVGTVSDRMVINDIPLLVITITEKIVKASRRQYFRCKCSSPVFFVEENQDLYDNSIQVHTVTKDLSGGGFSAVIDKKLHINTMIKGVLTLNNEIEVSFIGQVIKCIPYIMNSNQSLLGVSFRDISYKDRERIVAYVFRQQRKLLKKGLG